MGHELLWAPEDEDRQWARVKQGNKWRKKTDKREQTQKSKADGVTISQRLKGNENGAEGSLPGKAEMDSSGTK